MTTSQKVWETLKRIGSTPFYFYKSYRSFKVQYENKEALKMAAERTFVFLSKLPEIWRS